MQVVFLLTFVKPWQFFYSPNNRPEYVLILGISHRALEMKNKTNISAQSFINLKHTINAVIRPL